MDGTSFMSVDEVAQTLGVSKATPHISKKYRIQKKNTRQISRV